jgi:hypothetical protein
VAFSRVALLRDPLLARALDFARPPRDRLASPSMLNEPISSAIAIK